MGSVKLTDKEKTDVLSSWSDFCKGDVVDSGAHLYFSLFKKHPDTKKMFGFAKDKELSDEEMLQSKRFRTHVKKVYDTFGSVVEAMDDMSAVSADLKEMGARHIKYGITMEQYEYIGTSLMFSLENKLGSDFTADQKKAWTALYSVIEAAMVEGMKEASK